MINELKKLCLLFLTIVIVIALVPVPAHAAKAPLLDGIVSVEGNYALDQKGVLWNWDEQTFEAVPILEDVKAISGVNAAIKKDGTVWTWGRIEGSVEGPDGQYVYYKSFDQPAQVKGLSDAIAISNQYVLKADGTVWSIRGQCEYQLAHVGCAADASITDKLKPGRIGELSNIVAIESGGYFPAALDKDGKLWIWGRDKYNDPFLPIVIMDNANLNQKISLARGMVITASWDVYSIDRSAMYGLRLPNFNVAKLAPNVEAVAGIMNDNGDYFSYVLKKDGTVSYWISPMADKKLYPIKGLTQVKAVRAKVEGAGTALHKDGTVSSWGRMSNFYGDDKYKYSRVIVPVKVVKGIGLRLNGKYQLMENQPTLLNGSVFVPVRGLFESLNGKVEYANKIVTIKYEENVIVMELGKQDATINGATVKLPAPVQVIRGNTVVPLRFVAQAMGASVVWDGKNQQVLITTK